LLLLSRAAVIYASSTVDRRKVVDIRGKRLGARAVTDGDLFAGVGTAFPTATPTPVSEQPSTAASSEQPSSLMMSIPPSAAPSVSTAAPSNDKPTTSIGEASSAGPSVSTAAPSKDQPSISIEEPPSTAPSVSTAAPFTAEPSADASDAQPSVMMSKAPTSRPSVSSSDIVTVQPSAAATTEQPSALIAGPPTAGPTSTESLDKIDIIYDSSGNIFAVSGDKTIPCEIKSNLSGEGLLVCGSIEIPFVLKTVGSDVILVLMPTPDRVIEIPFGVQAETKNDADNSEDEKTKYAIGIAAILFAVLAVLGVAVYFCRK